MELLTAERLELRARDRLAHAMDMHQHADSERAKARHARRIAVAASMVQSARLYVRALSD